ncbi:MAG: hypothetical protein HQL41_10690 [Alphaproteobacteria bacterium]|nr:hypothetical protein [Alphaproteobacteria bacterium]
MRRLSFATVAALATLSLAAAAGAHEGHGAMPVSPLDHLLFDHGLMLGVATLVLAASGWAVSRLLRGRAARA